MVWTGNLADTSKLGLRSDFDAGFHIRRRHHDVGVKVFSVEPECFGLLGI